jgi:hypothetical protein
MNLAVAVLTIVFLLFTIGTTSMVFSLLIEKESNQQYIPTQPTHPMHQASNNIVELEIDTALDYFSDEDS